MAQPQFLKSIRPVNLLSFGPDTQEIELRPLNILIGPNGSGKSNLIEIVGLLSRLPDKDPWDDVIETGGVDEWIWKGAQKQNGVHPSIEIAFQAERPDDIRTYKIELAKNSSSYSLEVYSESILPYAAQDRGQSSYLNRASNFPGTAFIYEGRSPMSRIDGLDLRLSIFSQVFGRSYQLAFSDLPQKLAKIVLYRDWVFGVNSNPRSSQPVGLDSTHLAEDTRNLAQVLKAWRDRGDQATFDLLLTLLRRFYEPVKDVDVELVGTDVRVMIKEDGLDSRTPATRLSDGTIRWLALLTILLDPAPPPVVCLEEPELGLHPDAIHILADLLVEASSRTQLIVTTHSDALLDAFTDTPDNVCVCEKIEGTTRIQRLSKEKLASWLEDYSLGQLWAKGEIGGNRW